MQASTAPESEQVAAELLALWRLVIGTRSRDAAAYAIFEELDLTLTQVKALCALSHDELTVKELAARLGLSLPGASRAVDALVDRKLLYRREDEHDRRQKRLGCNDSGHVALRRLDEARLAGIAAFVATLPAEQCARLSTALRPILSDLRKQDA